MTAIGGCAANPRIIGAYEAQIARLEQKKLIAEEKAASLTHPRYAQEELFELTLRFLSNLWKIWESGWFALRRLVLKPGISERIR